ncbi:hypothetical protein D3C87_2090600 [compost metagenome]
MIDQSDGIVGLHPHFRRIVRMGLHDNYVGVQQLGRRYGADLDRLDEQARGFVVGAMQANHRCILR